MKKTGLLLVFMLILTPAVFAQLTSLDGLGAKYTSHPAGPAPATYGSDHIWLTLGSDDFRGIDTTVTFGYEFPPYGITRTGGLSWVHAPVHLPAGAVITDQEMWVCDNSATSDVVFSGIMYQNTSGSDFGYENGPTTSGQPGCVRLASTLTTPRVVNNNDYTLGVEVNLPVDSGVWLAGYRIGYHLQVSPPPAVATFLDVPTTSPQFKFVEALVAAGITGGCGGGNYCPSTYVTRGQMAVFLAQALGLHWPN